MNLWSTLFGTATSGSASGLTSPVSLTGLAGGGSPSGFSTGFAQFGTVLSAAPGHPIIYTTTGTTFGQSTGVSITKIAIEGDDVVLYLGTAPYFSAYARIPLAVLREALGPILEKALLGAFK